MALSFVRPCTAGHFVLCGIINLMFSNKDLVDHLVRGGYLKTPAIVDAFKKIDRADFIPAELRNEAYQDHALPIGFGQTISQPLTVAFMLELLQPKSGEKILDIGTGSGWVAGLLTEIAGPAGRVISIERIPELTKLAEKNLAKYKFLEANRLRLIIGDGSIGYEAGAPYDSIIAAASGERIQSAWRRQLKIGGRIVAPVGNSILKIDKVSKDEFKEKEYPGFKFVPLVSGT